MNEANANGKANEIHAKASQERMVRVSEKASLSTDDKRTASLDAHQTGLVNKIGSFITSKQLTKESTLMNTTNKSEKTKLICMSFDGDYVTEGEFQSVNEAWHRSNDMGSRWFFYPFHFVTTASGKTIKDTPELLQHLKGVRVKAVKKHFAEISKTPEA